MQNREKQDHDEAFIQRIIAVFGRKDETSFEEVVRRYRQIEEEFVALAGDDDALVLQRKQSITNHLLMDAENSEQPHTICHEIWEELLERGFMSVELRHAMSSTYAGCCQWNGEFDAGLAVVEPLIAELEVLLAQTALTPNHRAFCEQFIEIHREKHDELITGLRELLVPHSGE